MSMRFFAALIMVGVFIESALELAPAQSLHLKPQTKKPRRSTPTVQVQESEWPFLADDLDFEWMNLAIERQLRRLEKTVGVVQVRFGQQTYARSDLIETLESFAELVERAKACLGDRQQLDDRTKCMVNFNEEFRANFHLYRARGKNKKTRFTAYYTPEIEASLEPSAEYPFAIHSAPRTAKDKRLTRQEIDFGKGLHGQGTELFFTNHPFDIYLMQIEGGGKVVFPFHRKLKSSYLTYGGNNGRAWRYISRYMKKKGFISSESIWSQRAYLDENPQKWKEIFSYCPGYIYFNKSELPPRGSDSVPLTPFRSMATDRKYYRQKGILAFVVAEKPVRSQKTGSIVNRPFSRFVIDHDTGGAIDGAHRADLYFGEGKQGELAAYAMKSDGELFFIVKK